ncbi:hypothetical protein A4H97_08500 [Niastella yeongjuensis]|uniref:Lipocalin-like domain-containing protein n=1 Tax=Niastella yeongjuensis TaxID=354355 RepID=A0A1V9EN11_9BACT|nr:hypothetical protein [Niastella yeongjuensis]OQP47516.1 hypothetical protein A4H97_08500 [Niastella yeongjuensis]SEN87521.1 hypothetical protein SAMN05660816_01727 [Niastella yeongjuensis]
MKTRNFLLLLVAALVLVFVACSKEKSNETGVPPGGTTPIDTVPGPIDTTQVSTPGTVVGTWQFISVQSTGSQTAEFSQAGIPLKAVNTSNFTSQNNDGTVTFDSATMTATDISFSVNTNAATYVYQGNTIVDSIKTPINQNFPTQSASSDYKKVGADSLNFVNANFLDVLTGGLLPNPPTGCKVSFNGNMMKMTIVYDAVTTQDYQGVPAKVTIHMVMVVNLQKQ